MAPANKNLILSIINFADSCKDIYILFVRNKRGLRKLSTEAQNRLHSVHLRTPTSEALALAHSRSPSPLPASLNGDCTLLKLSRDASAAWGGFQRVEADGFSSLLDRYTANGRLHFYDKVGVEGEVDKCGSDTGGTRFAQMKCSCGESCTLVNGLTSCCKTSVDDLLFDLFGEMYLNRKKAFAIKVDQGDGDDPSMFYVGNYGSEPELSQTVDASER